MADIDRSSILEEGERYFIKRPIRTYSASGNWIENSYEIIIKGDSVYYYDNGGFSGLIKSLEQSHVVKNKAGQYLIPSSLLIAKVASYYRAKAAIEGGEIVLSNPYPRFEVAIAELVSKHPNVIVESIRIDQWYWYKEISKSFSGKKPDRVFKWNSKKSKLTEIKDLNESSVKMELARMA